MEQMTNYESIMAILDSGHYAVAKGKNGDYQIFSNSFGIIRKSTRSCQIEWTIGHIWEICTNKEEINSLELAEIYPLPREPQYIKVGDKVVIMENARAIDGFDDWNEKPRGMVNTWEYEVRDVVSNCWGISYLIYTKDKNDSGRFPAHCVCKAYKKPQATQEEIDKAIALLKDNGKIVDGKVLIG